MMILTIAMPFSWEFQICPSHRNLELSPEILQQFFYLWLLSRTSFSFNKITDEVCVRSIQLTQNNQFICKTLTLLK